MPKKYIQLLLSINFCLTAVTAIANPDTDNIENPTLIENPILEEKPPASWKDFYSNSWSSNEKSLKEQFDQIWDYLENIYKIYPSSTLQTFISEHKQLEEDVNSEHKQLEEDVNDDSEEIAELLSILKEKMALLPDCQLAEPLEIDNKNLIKIQFDKILACRKTIDELYNKNSEILSEEMKVFLRNQLAELLDFSCDFLEHSEELLEGNLNSEDPPHRIKKRDMKGNMNFSFELASDNQLVLDNQFNQIWDCIDKINAIYRSKFLQEIISDHRKIEAPSDESSEEVSKETLEKKLLQLHESLESCYQYQPEKLNEDNKAQLGVQFKQINNYLSAICDTYDEKKESLSRKEKVFLRDQLKELHKFFYNFMTHPPLSLEEPYNFSHSFAPEEDTRLNSLVEIQTLLDSCKEEDSLIYPQYECIMNSQETNISDFLTNSETKNVIKNNFLYFNKDEGLVEIQHIKASEDGEKTYTTTWKIRPNDAGYVSDWNQSDLIDIVKTNLFTKYTMFGEKLDYTLANHKRSVRANFVCKSSNKNTYTILSIDYLGGIVVLKNGPCLFVERGDLKEWHVRDAVVLQRIGAVTDTASVHELINRTRRNKIVMVFLKSDSKS